MRLKYHRERLQIKTEDRKEEKLIKNLVRLVQAVSNDLMAWYGDIEPEGSGYIITWKPGKNETVEVPETVKK